PQECRGKGTGTGTGDQDGTDASANEPSSASTTGSPGTRPPCASAASAAVSIKIKVTIGRLHVQFFDSHSRALLGCFPAVFADPTPCASLRRMIWSTASTGQPCSGRLSGCGRASLDGAWPSSWPIVGSRRQTPARVRVYQCPPVMRFWQS